MKRRHPARLTQRPQRRKLQHGEHRAVVALRFPTQDRLAGGGGFIEARDARGVGRLEDELRVLFDLFGDGAQGDQQVRAGLVPALRKGAHEGCRYVE